MDTSLKNLSTFFEIVKATQKEGVTFMCNECAKSKHVYGNRKDIVAYINDHAICKEKIHELREKINSASFQKQAQSVKPNRYGSDVDSAKGDPLHTVTEPVVNRAQDDKARNDDIQVKYKEMERKIDNLQKERHDALAKIKELEKRSEEMKEGEREIKSKLEISEKNKRTLEQEMKDIQRRYDDETMKMATEQSDMSKKIRHLESEKDKLNKRKEDMVTNNTETTKRLEETKENLGRIQRDRG